MYEVTIGWPSVESMSMMTGHFYRDLGPITEDMEKTQFGINFLMTFIKSVEITDQLSFSGEDRIVLNLLDIDNF